MAMSGVENATHNIVIPPSRWAFILGFHQLSHWCWLLASLY